MNKHGFWTYKWNPDNDEVQQYIEQSLELEKEKSDTITKFETVGGKNLKTQPNEVITPHCEKLKCLGVAWRKQPDGHSYIIHDHWVKIVPKTDKITKKIISSCIGQCFDPIGVLAPIVLVGRFCLFYAWQLPLKS